MVAGEIISVICAAETESDTISATLSMMKMITTKFSRKMYTWVGAESLRDIFSERPETNIYIERSLYNK